MSVENLWGEIPAVGTVTAPVTILKRQAAVLGDLTRRILEAEVSPLITPNPSTIVYTFNMVAPALGNFRYELLRIQHDPALLYPVTVFERQDVRHYECGNERQFVKALGEILSSPSTHQIIASLLAQSEVAA